MAFTFRILQERDVQEVVKLISKSFFMDEPLCACLDFQFPEETQFHVENLVPSCIGDAISVVAIDNSTGEIIGCRLSVIDVAGVTKEAKDDPNDANQRKISIVGKFLRSMEEGVDVFKLYNVDKCLTFIMLNVRDDYRSKGIAKQLVEMSVNLAIGKGVRLVKVIASNKITVKLYEKQGYDNLKVIRYCDYKDENGEVPFNNMGDNTQAVLYAKRIG